MPCQIGPFTAEKEPPCEYGSHTLTQILTSGLLGLTLMGAIAEGCSKLRRGHQTGARKTNGSVQFEEVADWSFEASHPARSVRHDR